MRVAACATATFLLSTLMLVRGEGEITWDYGLAMIAQGLAPQPLPTGKAEDPDSTMVTSTVWNKAEISHVWNSAGEQLTKGPVITPSHPSDDPNDSVTYVTQTSFSAYYGIVTYVALEYSVNTANNAFTSTYVSAATDVKQATNVPQFPSVTFSTITSAVTTNLAIVSYCPENSVTAELKPLTVSSECSLLKCPHMDPSITSGAKFDSTTSYPVTRMPFYIEADQLPQIVMISSACVCPSGSQDASRPVCPPTPVPTFHE